MKNSRIKTVINIILIVAQLILLITAILAIMYTNAIHSYTSIANLYFYDGAHINSYKDTYEIAIWCCIIIPLISFFIEFKHINIKIILIKTLILFIGCFICIFIVSNYEDFNSAKITVISSPDNSKEIIVEEGSDLLDMWVCIYEYADKDRNIIHCIYNPMNDTYYDKNNYYYHMEENLYRVEWKENGVVIKFLNYKDKSIENSINLEFDY